MDAFDLLAQLGPVDIRHDQIQNDERNIFLFEN